MTCRKVALKLPAFLANELPERARSRIEKHLKHCVLCTAELRALKRTDELLDTLGEVEPRRDLVGLVMRRIEREQETTPAFKRFLISLRERRPQLVRTAAYVLAVFMLAFGSYRYYESRRSPMNRATIQPVAVGGSPVASTRVEVPRALAPFKRNLRRFFLVAVRRLPAPDVAAETEDFTFRLDESGVESLNREMDAARSKAGEPPPVEAPFEKLVPDVRPVELQVGRGGSLIIEPGSSGSKEPAE